MNKKEGEREIAQVEFVGKPFNRYPDGSPHPQQRKVRIIGSYRPKSGTMSFRSAHTSPTVTSDLPHIALTEAKMHDVANVSRSLQTARKDGASTPGADIEKKFRKRGGNGTRIPKRGGFSSQAELRKIQKIRSKKGSSVCR